MLSEEDAMEICPFNVCTDHHTERGGPIKSPPVRADRHGNLRHGPTASERNDTTGAPQASAPAQGPPWLRSSVSLACAGGVPLPQAQRSERKRRSRSGGESYFARPSFSTSAFSRAKVSAANFWYCALLMYMGTMS